jgi:hypothetical protein
VHTWLNDAQMRLVVADTLTAEPAQLRVDDFRPDPVKQEIRTSSSLGMTPFETAYRTADGYLMSAFPRGQCTVSVGRTNQPDSRPET